MSLKGNSFTLNSEPPSEFHRVCVTNIKRALKAAAEETPLLKQLKILYIISENSLFRCLSVILSTQHNDNRYEYYQSRLLTFLKAQNSVITDTLDFINSQSTSTIMNSVASCFNCNITVWNLTLPCVVAPSPRWTSDLWRLFLSNLSIVPTPVIVSNKPTEKLNSNTSANRQTECDVMINLNINLLQVKDHFHLLVPEQERVSLGISLYESIGCCSEGNTLYQSCLYIWKQFLATNLQITARIKTVEQKEKEIDRRRKQRKEIKLNLDEKNVQTLSRLEANEREVRDIEGFYSLLKRASSLSVCEICGEQTPLYKLKQKNIMELKERLSASNSQNSLAVLNLLTETSARVFHRSNNEMKFCGLCDGYSAKGKIPPWSLANSFEFGDIPPELQGLSIIEQRMIALVIPFQTIIIRRCGQQISKGHVLNFHNDIVDVCKRLPRNPEANGYYLVNIDEMSSEGFSICRRRRYNARKVKDALVFLSANNPLYKHVAIELNALDEQDSVCECTSCTQADSNSIDSHGVNESFETDMKHSFSHVPHEFDLSQASQIVNHFAVEESASAVLQMKRSKKFASDWDDPNLILRCFPHLFPFGRGGLVEPGRSVPLRKGKIYYYRHLLKYYDQRFTRDQSFTFWALNLWLRDRAAGVALVGSQSANISNLYLKSKSMDSELSTSTNHSINQSISIGQLRQAAAFSEATRTAKTLFQRLITYGSSLPGTAVYMQKARQNLMAMITSPYLPVPVPTFFITLSSADLHWREIFRMVYSNESEIDLDERIKKLTKQEREKIIADNPMVAAMHFADRFEAFKKHILNGLSKPLGTVVDYFFRVESQMRGSLHIHGLLWVKEMENVVELLENKQGDGHKQIADFIDQHIKCTVDKSQINLKENSDSEDSQTQSEALLSLEPKNQIKDNTNSPIIVDFESKYNESTCHDNSSESKAAIVTENEYKWDNHIKQCHHPALFESARLPLDSKEVTERIRQLILQCNMHSHTHTCYKYQKFKDRLNVKAPASAKQKCRFNFPKQTVYHTNITYDERKSKDPSKPSKFDLKVHYKRNESDKNVNNYNPMLTNLWAANTDLSFIANPFGAAVYTAKYAVKDDKADIPTLQNKIILKLLKQHISAPLKKQLNTILMCDISNREFSKQEACFILSGNPIVEMSRQVVLVDVGLPESRTVLLKSSWELAALPDSDQSIERDGPRSRLGMHINYAARPYSEQWNQLSLFQFAKRYEVIGVISESEFQCESKLNSINEGDILLEEETNSYLKSAMFSTSNVNLEEHKVILSNGVVLKMRSYDAVINTTPPIKFSIEHQDHRQYYYSILLLHCPWRDKHDFDLSLEDLKSLLQQRLSSLPQSLQQMLSLQARIQSVVLEIPESNSENDSGSIEDSQSDSTQAESLMNDIDYDISSIESEINEEDHHDHDDELGAESDILDLASTDHGTSSSAGSDYVSLITGGSGDSLTRLTEEELLRKIRLQGGLRYLITNDWCKYIRFVKTKEEDILRLLAQSHAGTDEEVRRAQTSQKVREQLVKDIKMMNEKQELALRLVASSLQKSTQLKLIVTGAGGTGKSFLISTIVKYANYYFGSPKSTLLMAPTGVAAFNIGGTTIHKALKLRANGDNSNSSIDKVSQSSISRLENEIGEVKLIIIDEVSMVGAQTLNIINSKLNLTHNQTKTNSNEIGYFGGVHVILLGDIFQLSPVGQTSLYNPFGDSEPAVESDPKVLASSNNHTGSLNSNLNQPQKSSDMKMGQLIWNSFKRVIILDQQQRQQDSNFAATLNRLRVGEPEVNDLTLINTRVVNDVEELQSQVQNMSLNNSKAITVWACALKEKVKEINERCLNSLKQSGQATISVFAQHSQTDGTKCRLKKSTRKKLLNFWCDDIVKSSALNKSAPILKLSVGSRVVLLKNLSISLGLVNGALGIVYAFAFPNPKKSKHNDPHPLANLGPIVLQGDADTVGSMQEQPQLPIVLVKFDRQFYKESSCIEGSEGVVPITAFDEYIEFEGKRYCRRQIPLALAWATTIHKIQGLTLPSVIVDCTRFFGAGMEYVALSRVKELQHLSLTAPLQVGNFKKANQTRAKLKAEMERLTKLSELTISYARTLSAVLTKMQEPNELFNDFPEDLEDELF